MAVSAAAVSDALPPAALLARGPRTAAAGVPFLRLTAGPDALRKGTCGA
jgi:hypothetical protein